MTRHIHARAIVIFGSVFATAEAAIAFDVSCPVSNGSCLDQSFSGTSGTSSCQDVCTGKGQNKVCQTECTESYDLLAYGDSIMAGYEVGWLFPGQIKSVVGYYADLAAAEGGISPSAASVVSYHGDTLSGGTVLDVLAFVDNATSRNRLASADLFMFSVGGNNFLQARSAFASSCNEAALVAAVEAFKADWDDFLDHLVTYGNPAAVRRAMNIYYPGVNADKSKTCNGKSHFAAFLPLLLQAGDYMCSTAIDAGFDCADAIQAINCDQLADGSFDTDCPTSYADIDPNFVDPATIANRIAHFRDGNAVLRTGPETCTQVCTGRGNNKTCINECTPGALQTVDYIQSDDVHTNAAGHRSLADAFGVLGFSELQ